MPWPLALALLLLRLSVGLLIAAHGLNHVLGWSTFRVAAGGSGWAAAAIAGELLGGLGVATGLCARLAAAGLAAVMLGIVGWFQAGLFSQIGTGKGVPLEYPLLAALVAIALAISGPGPWSLDAWRKGGRR